MTSPSRPGQQRRARRPDDERSAGTPRWRVTAARGAWVVAGLALVALVVRLAVGDPALDGPVELAAADVEQARSAAGCRVVATEPAGDSTHLSTDVTLDQVDTGPVQPPTGAAHYQGTNFLVEEGIDRQLDVLSLGHNLEHGAVTLWYDPAEVDGDTIARMQEWSSLLNNSGFADQGSGAGIFVAPFADPGISSGAAVALRSWGLGVDCETFDDVAADSFVVEAYGNRDVAPEGVAYPDATLGYGDPAPTPWRAAEAG